VTLPVYEVPLVIHEGRDETLDFGPITRLDSNGDPQPVDLTLPGTKLWFFAKAFTSDEDADAVVAKTYVQGGGGSGITVDGSGFKNTGTISIAASETENGGTTRRLAYDLMLEDSVGGKDTIQYGPLTILRSTGRPA